MTDGPAMTPPGGRALLGWWRELGPVAPRRMWYAHPVLVRIEALAEVAGLPPDEALARALAGVLATSGGGRTAAWLASALSVPPPLAELLLARLESEGAVRREGGVAAVTAAGEALARADGEVPPRMERRVFRFTAGSAPHFVALSSASPWAPPADWHFGLEPLEEALARPAEWKARHGFPSDVRRIVRAPAEPTGQDWPRVPLAAVEQATLAVVESGALGGRVLAFPVRPDGWELAREPAWELPSAAELAEVFGEVPASAWRQAWQAWCQQRNLPAAEVEVCGVELEGHRLLVRAPARLVERLRQERSDAVKGEAWLSAGAGRLRGLARVEFVGEGP